MAFAVSRVLPQIRRLRFADRSIRWQLTAAGIRVLRCALTGPVPNTAASSGNGSSAAVAGLAAAVAGAFGREGVMQGYLLMALPPAAALLPGLPDLEEVEAHGAAAEWLRLLPPLLRAALAVGVGAVVAAPFFQVC